MTKTIGALALFLLGSLCLANTGTSGLLDEPRAGKPVIIPTRYNEHRFVATPVTEDNMSLTLFTDSAGGLFIFEDSAEKLHLKTVKIPPEGEKGQPLLKTDLPKFKEGASIPSPLGADDGRLLVFPRQQDARSMASYDGMLGQQWFAGRVWTFDYPNKKLLWRATNDLPAHDKGHEIRLGFKTNAAGKRILNFARIPVEIDGELIDFVLDTGATNILSESALKQIGDGKPADRATSFLARSMYERWRAKHPDWRALDKVETLTGSSMIEVPSIKLGGFTVGPVWFTVQPDNAFHKYMAQYMDKPTEGALGGSALQYFRMTVDWPGAIAIFERP